MAGNADEPDERQRQWKGESVNKLNSANEQKQKVRQKIIDLEKKQADKEAARQAEKRRQERLAAEAAARAKREQEEKVRAAFKKAQAEELARKQAAVKQGKRDEMNALKEATAAYHAAMHADSLLQNKVTTFLRCDRSMAALQNITILCQKQCKMWFVAVQKCSMRLEAREGRPDSEKLADNVQVALEKELAVLKDSRESLKQFSDDGEKLIRERPRGSRSGVSLAVAAWDRRSSRKCHDDEGGRQKRR